MTISPPRPKLLAIDDQPAIFTVLERFASTRGFDVVFRTDGRSALADLAALRPDVVLVDLQMPDIDGLDVLRALREVDPSLPVILMTGNPTVDTAIEAVKLGALDYISKPFDLKRLGELLAGIGARLEQREHLLEKESEVAREVEFHGMIGRSPVMQELFEAIRRFAPHVRTALITGETGTGKELVARALHLEGPRAKRRFVAYNCSAIVETLFESEFFGHTRGAFTGATEAKPGLFEHADDGTLFLDEIGEMPLAAQAKLLRVVEYGEVQRLGSTEARRVDVSVIAATNRDLRAEVRAGRFRDDLFYRLDVVEINLAPLRDRREDLAYLTAAFVNEFAKRFNKPIAGLSSGAERLLQRAHWPGNVRELRNALERACMLCDGRLVTERELENVIVADADKAAASVAPAREVSREEVEQALQQAGGNKSEAARVLGLSRRAFYRRLETFGIE